MTDATDRSPQTIRLYAGDWAAFVAWCRGSAAPALPAEPDIVAAYLASLSATLSPGALERRRAAIRDQHRREGYAAPTAAPAIKALLRAVRLAARPRRKPTPPASDLTRMGQLCAGDLAGLRDRALLLLMAATRLGRTGLIGLDAEHVRFTATGVTLADLPVARHGDFGVCPVRALEDWLRASDTQFGPVFRKVDRWGNVEHQRLGADAIRRILARRAASRGRGKACAA